MSFFVCRKIAFGRVAMRCGTVRVVAHFSFEPVRLEYHSRIELLIIKWGSSPKNYLSGLMMARWRSTAIAVSVNTDTFTLTVCTNGQNAHINAGRFHRWSRAAWNCMPSKKWPKKRERKRNKRHKKNMLRKKRKIKNKEKRLEIMKQSRHLFESFSPNKWVQMETKCVYVCVWSLHGSAC